ncbi:DinB family protein [bacterium]|nr:DinB family protein [candidate division CSSED10-310 bacterium]
MISSLQYLFAFNDSALEINMEGISHDDTLINAPNGGNNINWLLGHIIVSRDLVFQALETDCMSDASITKKYDRGTSSVPKSDAISLDELHRMHKATSRAIKENLLAFDPEKLTDQKREMLLFLALHEVYHIGQIGLMRRIIGKQGAIR